MAGRAAVGDNPLKYAMCKNARADHSAYTMSVPRKTEGRGASPTGRAGNKSNTLIHDAQGPRCHISEVLYKANAAAANDTGSGMYRVSSKAGFWDKRNGV